MLGYIYSITSCNVLSFSNACADHDVHQRLKQLAEDFVCEDGRRLAHLQPPASLHRGPRPHLHGHPQVKILFFFLNLMRVFLTGPWDDRNKNQGLPMSLCPSLHREWQMFSLLCALYGRHLNWLLLLSVLPSLFSTKVKRVNKQIRCYLRWSILWISSFGLLFGL